MRIVVHEDRIQGRRLVLKDGVLALEPCRKLEPAQVAMLAQAAIATLSPEDEAEVAPVKSRGA